MPLRDWYDGRAGACVMHRGNDMVGMNVRRIVAILVALTFLSSLPTVAGASPVASPVASPAASSCDGWYAYRLDMVRLWRDFSVDDYDALTPLFDVAFRDYAMIPAPSLRHAANALDTYALAVAGVQDVPEALHDLHTAYMGRVVLVSHYARVNADGDVLGIAYYDEQLRNNEKTIRGDVTELRTSCPAAWAQLTGSRETPYPLMNGVS